jgi:predicted nucleic acid-binding protein
MILDTTYILPLAQISIDTDILLAEAEDRTSLRLDKMSISSISIFELQTKAAKLQIPATLVSTALEAIQENFEIVPFSDPKVIEQSFELRDRIPDYIDCLIVATAAVRNEELASEDSRIWKERKALWDNYGVKVSRYRDLVRTTPEVLRKTEK